MGGVVPDFDHTGPFIWAAYGVSAFVLGALIAYVLARAAGARARLERLEKLEEAEAER